MSLYFTYGVVVGSTRVGVRVRPGFLRHSDFLLRLHAFTFVFSFLPVLSVGRDSVVCTATRYGLDGLGIESRLGRDFPHPDRPWVPPSLLDNGYRVIPAVWWSGRGADHPPPSSAEVKERVELYLYYTSKSSWSVLGRIFIRVVEVVGHYQY
jgi:hypothetical protein